MPKKQKREKIVEKAKKEIRAVKSHKTKRGMSLFNIEKKNYKSDTKDGINLNKAKNKSLLVLWETIGEIRYD